MGLFLHLLDVFVAVQFRMVLCVSVCRDVCVCPTEWNMSDFVYISCLYWQSCSFNFLDTETSVFRSWYTELTHYWCKYKVGQQLKALSTLQLGM